MIEIEIGKQCSPASQRVYGVYLDMTFDFDHDFDEDANTPENGKKNAGGAFRLYPRCRESLPGP
ncbi:hypothetical protein [Desulfonatronum thiodismutans]|uniref:hypothetical protein n=1 Tax=Desulfonatronum thiodismutans TaxID=159290 RepID=UPI001267C54E|nr:hypothetical protein [Desulfonatronum thiodismutans]